jgi:hypothetical protein
MLLPIVIFGMMFRDGKYFFLSATTYSAIGVALLVVIVGKQF